MAGLDIRAAGIVAFTHDDSDLRLIAREGHAARVCASLDHALAAAQHATTTLFVCDARAVMRGDPGELSRRLGALLPRCPIVIRHDATTASALELYHLASLVADIRTSFRAYQSSVGRLDWPLGGTTSTLAILERVGAVLPPGCRGEFGVLVILCERPVLQPAAAATLGLSTSGFRHWLAQRRTEMPLLPRFPRLNAILLALHVLWRRERLQWNGKATARAAGFGDEKACSNYLHYHVGKTTRQLIDDGGFSQLSAEVIGWFNRSPRGSRHRDTGRTPPWRISGLSGVS